MSIFNENGSYINIKDPLERIPYMLQEMNLIYEQFAFLENAGALPANSTFREQEKKKISLSISV